MGIYREMITYQRFHGKKMSSFPESELSLKRSITMRRILFILLGIFMILSSCHLCLAENLTSGDFIYTVFSDGTAEIVSYIGSEEEVEIPGELEGSRVISIGNSAFSHNKNLTAVTIPESVTVLGSASFAECINLRSITLPAGLRTISDMAFQGNVRLESITLPAGITFIGNNPFDRCDSLSEIKFEAENSFYPVEDGILYDRQNTALISYPAGKTDKTYTVPDWVTAINLAAFSENPYLEEIILHADLTDIEENPFCGCTALKNISISVFNPVYEMYAGSLINIQQRILVAYLWVSGKDHYSVQNGIRSIGQEAFYKHSELKTIELPQSLVFIGDAAFAESGLTSINIPENVTSLGNSTFMDCSDLEKVTLPSSLTWIGRNTFSECSSLKSIKFPKMLYSIGDAAFYHCTALSELILPDKLQYIGDYAFLECTGLTTVDFPDRLLSIGRAAFYGNENMTAKVAPGSLAEKWATQNEVPFTRKNVTYMTEESV